MSDKVYTMMLINLLQLDTQDNVLTELEHLSLWSLVLAAVVFLLTETAALKGGFSSSSGTRVIAVSSTGMIQGAASARGLVTDASPLSCSC